jgi:hypothetical protein
MQRAKDIMSRFCQGAAGGGPPQAVSIQPLDTGNPDVGKMWITFAKPEEAEAALNAYPSGPWKLLKPFIQTPRGGTMVQVK